MMSANIQTWTEGYLAVRERAAQCRGEIELDTGVRCPRANGHDVLMIVALFDPALREHATPGLSQRWQSVLDELRQLGPAEATFPNNATFWETLAVAAVYLEHRAVAPPGPSMWDVLIGYVDVQTRRNAGPSAADPFGLKAPTFDDLWRAQRDYFVQKRGFDQPEPPSGFGMWGMKIPRTTNYDVLEISAYWSGQLANAREVTGYKTAVDKWNAALADVDKLAKTGKPEDVYAKNNEFWRTLNDVSIQIAIGDEAPTKWDLAKESVKESVTHLPSTIEDAASKGIDLVASAAHAVGKVANEAGKGLFEGFGTPLLIGAGLLGLFLITRSSDHEEV
jgi:hypothetical protein